MASKPVAILKGLKELHATFDELGKRATGTVMRKAVRAGAAPIRKAMRAKAPKRTGDLRKSIKTVVRKLNVGYSAVTGPDRNYEGGPTPGSRTRTNIPRNYLHLIEFGFTARDGSPVPARPFARPAFDENEQHALFLMRQKLAVEIMAEARKAAAKRKAG